MVQSKKELEEMQARNRVILDNAEQKLARTRRTLAFIRDQKAVANIRRELNTVNQRPKRKSKPR